MSEAWKKCTSCRNPIGFSTKYWLCSVSTCQRKKMPLYFCAVSCWDAHLATANHREAWAIDKQSPSKAEWMAEESATPAPAAAPAPSKAKETLVPGRRVVATATSPASPTLSDDVPKDILIVVSKLKAYIRARSGMKTSDGCSKILSDHVRKMCDVAIKSATEHERKTVLDRDFVGIL